MLYLCQPNPTYILSVSSELYCVNCLYKQVMLRLKSHDMIFNELPPLIHGVTLEKLYSR